MTDRHYHELLAALREPTAALRNAVPETWDAFAALHERLDADLLQPPIAGEPRVAGDCREIGIDASRLRDPQPPAKVAQPEPVSNKEVISQDLLDELRGMGMGEEFVAKFLTECARDARKCVADLDVAGRGRDWQAFRDACHALKGTAGNMGASRLAESASQGMGMTAERLLDEWQLVVDRLRQQLEQTLTALRAGGNMIAADVDQDSAR